MYAQQLVWRTPDGADQYDPAPALPPTIHSAHMSTLALHICLCGSLAQCALSLKRLSAGTGFNPQTQQNKLFQDYWRACFEINFSDRQEGLTVSSVICDH